MPYNDIDLVWLWLRVWLVAWQLQAITWIYMYLSLAEFYGGYPRAITERVPKFMILYNEFENYTFKSPRG